MVFVSDSTKQALMDRAQRRCECHSPACRHHRPASRCTAGLRGDEWHVVVREQGAGEKLWNLVAVCPRCYTASAADKR